MRLIKKSVGTGTICFVDRKTFGPCGDSLHFAERSTSTLAPLRSGAFFDIDIGNTITVQNCTRTIVTQWCYLARSGLRRGVSCLQQHTPCYLRDPLSPVDGNFFGSLPLGREDRTGIPHWGVRFPSFPVRSGTFQHSLAPLRRGSFLIYSTQSAGDQLIFSQCLKADTAPSLAQVIMAPTVSPAKAISPEMP